MPGSEQELATEALAYFTSRLDPDRPRDGSRPPTGISDLLTQGWVRADPIVYEDFLPRSAAGIFQSNLSDEGTRDDAVTGTRRDAGWLSDVMGVQVADPTALYAAQQQASLEALFS